MPTLIDSRSSRGTASRRILFPSLEEKATLTIHFSAGGSRSTIRVPGFTEPDPLRDEFTQLADLWHGETDHLSSPSQIAMHPAYLRVIGLGERAIPLILNDLRRRGGQWYLALRAITNEKPVPDAASGNIRRMKEAWLHWGAAHGHIAAG